MELWSLKSQKWLNDSKKSVTVSAKHLNASERPCLALLENAMDSELHLAGCQPLSFGIFLLSEQFFRYFYP